MSTERLKLALRLSLCIPIGLIVPTIARADAYYTVTDLGPINSVVQNGQAYVNAQTGVSFPFVITQGTPLSASVYADRPGVYAQDGVQFPTRELFQMNIGSENSAGTVIGTVPSGESHGDPWQTVTYGYAVYSPTTGQWFTGFIPLPTGGMLGLQGTVSLSQNANMILVNSDAGAGGTALFNAATGTSTPLSQLVSPSFLRAARCIKLQHSVSRPSDRRSGRHPDGGLGVGRQASRLRAHPTQCCASPRADDIGGAHSRRSRTGLPSLD